MRKHAFIIIGGGSVKRYGYLNIITKLLDNNQIRYTIFGSIEPNPLSATIDKAAGPLTRENIIEIFRITEDQSVEYES
ncbi:MAG: iron-containing alcohol dehydrogenase, partial [Balneolaceae bacterium]